jgi:2-isopropylmalate synthase
LFGNGERTGNVDLLTVAYNMFSHGVNPMLKLENINEIIEVYERCVKIPVHVRHPYAGDLVFTAFSGSHQDAINKGVRAMKERKQEWWEVPYLPIDPSDVGREYEPIVRINSQSGKGGVAFVMDSEFGYKLPKEMHKEFADVIQKIAEKQGEVAPATILDEFVKEYLTLKTPYEFLRAKAEDYGESDTKVELNFIHDGMLETVSAIGNGPLDAVKLAMQQTVGVQVSILDYSQHALGEGSHAKSAAYICMRDEKTGKVTFGVGVSSNITKAGMRAVFSALNRLAK